MSNHKSMRRIVHRCAEELDATIKIAKVLSIGEALETFRAKVDIQIMNRNGYYENESRKKHLLRKHDIMIRYFEKPFGDFFNTYDYNHDKEFLPKSDYSDCIWVCWWQGLDEAPELVKTCVESIKKNAGDHRVIVLTEDNYKHYVEIPEWVEEKKNKGIITRTHYSDLLRLSLLAKHGGMWLDSTLFCTAPVLDEYFKWPLWSIKRPDYFHASIASGYFANYSLACSSDNRFAFMTIRDFFLNYWKHNDSMVDYLMVDYMIVLAQKYDKRIAKIFSGIEPNNPNCDELHKVLGDEFNSATWEKIKKETYLFKLSWKYQYLKDKNEYPTFYSKLIKRTL